MRTRQRRTLSLEVSTDQKAVLDRVVAALPTEPSDAPKNGASGLPALFYHPNCAARVLALTLSAGFDAINGKADNAVRKIDRAIQVFTLVDDDERGRAHLQTLKEQVNDDLASFLSGTHDRLIPYLRKRMADVAIPPKAPEPVAMPRAIGEGEEMPTERRSGAAAKRERRPRARRREEDAVQAESAQPEVAEAPAEPSPEAAAPEPAAEEVEAPTTVEELPAVGNDDGDTAESVGPSEAEAAAAAAAALAAMEAPYEDVVEDDAKPRFDPDRDLEPSDGRRRRRRSRSPEGLERPRPALETDRPEPQAAESDAPAEPAGDEAAREEGAVHRASRSGSADEVAEVALEVLRQALRRAREAGLEGRVRVEVSISAGGVEPKDDRRRRRRRRRPRSD